MNQRLISKILIIAWLFAVMICLLAGCSSERQLSRAIKKHGREESLAFMVKKFPYLFVSKTDSARKDSMPIPVEVVTKAYTDSIPSVRDSGQDLSLNHETENGTLIVKRAKGVMDYSYRAKPKVIHDTIYKNIVLPCPEQKLPDLKKIINPEPEETFLQLIYKYGFWILLGFDIILLVIVFLLGRLSKKLPPEF